MFHAHIHFRLLKLTVTRRFRRVLQRGRMREPELYDGAVACDESIGDGRGQPDEDVLQRAGTRGMSTRYEHALPAAHVRHVVAGPVSLQLQKDVSC